MPNLHELENKIGYTFNNKDLLRDALTHSSFLNECSDKSRVCNERLEFLGDAVLGTAVSDYMYKHHPESGEGKMSQVRAVVVCENGLYAFAKEVGLGNFLYVAHGEDCSGGRDKPSILSDAVEAMIAAVYLDSDFKTARSFVIKHFEKYIVSAFDNNKSNLDYKSRLQEHTLSKGHSVKYRLIGESGPDHDKIFTAEVSLNNEIVAKGSGLTKKKAEQQAAKAMLEILKNKNWF